MACPSAQSSSIAGSDVFKRATDDSSTADPSLAAKETFVQAPISGDLPEQLRSLVLANALMGVRRTGLASQHWIAATVALMLIVVVGSSSIDLLGQVVESTRSAFTWISTPVWDVRF